MTPENPSRPKSVPSKALSKTIASNEKDAVDLDLAVYSSIVNPSAAADFDPPSSGKKKRDVAEAEALTDEDSEEDSEDIIIGRSIAKKSNNKDGSKDGSKDDSKDDSKDGSKDNSKDDSKDGSKDGSKAKRSGAKGATKHPKLSAAEQAAAKAEKAAEKAAAKAKQAEAKKAKKAEKTINKAEKSKQLKEARAAQKEKALQEALAKAVKDAEEYPPFKSGEWVALEYAAELKTKGAHVAHYFPNYDWCVGEISLVKLDYCWVKFRIDGKEVQCFLPRSGYDLYWVFIDEKMQRSPTF